VSLAPPFDENVAEQALLEWLADLGWEVLYGPSIAKKVAGYHQFHATRKAVATTVRASSAEGDRRAGVVWHTQGSGKSLTMAFYAGKLVVEPALANPTAVVITDRNDLDDQLFGVFSRCADPLRQTPVQAEDRAYLRRLLPPRAAAP